VQSRNGTSTTLLHVLALCSGILAVSFSSILIRWSSAPAAVIGMYRLCLTVLLLLPLAARQRRQVRNISRQDMLLLVVAGIFLAFHFLFWIESLKLTSVASSMIFISLQPLFVMLGAFVWFRERTSLRTLFGTGLALAGSVFIALGDVGTGGHHLTGDALSLLGTMAISGYMLVGQSVRGRLSASLYNGIVFAVAAVVLWFYNVITKTPMTGYGHRDWTLFVLLALIPTLFGHALFNWLLRYVSAAAISMTILGEPVGAMALAWVLLGEPLLPYQVAGALLTLAGVGWFLRVRYTAGKLY